MPVTDAWVWLYADNGGGPVQTGDPDQVDANGDYTVTAGSLGNGVYDFTIRASEPNTFDEDTNSFDSPALSVQIFYEDLTNVILDDLVAELSPRWMQIKAAFNARGGMTECVTVEHTAEHTATK